MLTDAVLPWLLVAAFSLCIADRADPVERPVRTDPSSMTQNSSHWSCAGSFDVCGTTRVDPGASTRSAILAEVPPKECAPRRMLVRSAITT